MRFSLIKSQKFSTLTNEQYDLAQAEANRLAPPAKWDPKFAAFMVFLGVGFASVIVLIFADYDVTHHIPVGVGVLQLICAGGTFLSLNSTQKRHDRYYQKCLDTFEQSNRKSENVICEDDVVVPIGGGQLTS